MKKTKNLVLFLLPASLILSHSFLSPSILLFFSCIPFPSPFFLLFHPLLHFTSPPRFLYLSHVSVSVSLSGLSPGQEFTAVIHATSPLVSQSQPIMKLLQVVSRSKYCSQVLLTAKAISSV